MLHAFFLALLILGVAYYYCLPNKLFQAPRSTLLLDKNGALLGATIASDGQWRFPHTDTLPERFIVSLIEFEDRNFHEHFGFHLPSFMRAAYQNLKENRIVSGASTLSMQVIRMSRGTRERSILEKLIEVVLATRLEIRYSKQEILAMWASNAPFGGNVVGLETAAWRYYDRAPDQLSWSESATLAVLPNAPSLIYPGRSSDALEAKRNRLLERLRNAGMIDDLEFQLAIEEPVPSKPEPLPRSAPHLLQRCIKEGMAGNRITSTLDIDVQENAKVLLEDHIIDLKANEIHNAAALVLDLNSGSVLAYVGNTASDAGDHGQQVDMITATRSTGSILKPFLFASMLDHGEILPAALIPDIPTNIAGFAPKNFNKGYAGAVPANEALARSLNVPAVRMLKDHGVARFHKTLQRLELDDIDRTPGHYGLSLILGGAESSLWDLSMAYARMSMELSDQFRSVSQKKAPPPGTDPIIFHYRPATSRASATYEPVFSPSAIYLTLEALTKVNRPGSEMGWQEMASRQKVAWKTGTSFGHKDAWAIGTTPDYLVSVWVGNANGEGKPGNTGVSTAAPLMFDILNSLDNSGWFEPPHDDLEQIVVCSKSGFRYGMNCEGTDTIRSTMNGVRSETCPYHKTLRIDKRTQRISDDGSLTADEIELKKWFSLPPAMEWYYKKSDPSYMPLPERSKTELTFSAESPMELVNPSDLSTVKIPTDLDGNEGVLVLEIAHKQKMSEIFWHLDDDYIGETNAMHQISISLAPGSHELTAIDNWGNELNERFVVLP